MKLMEMVSMKPSLSLSATLGVASTAGGQESMVMTLVVRAAEVLSGLLRETSALRTTTWNWSPLS